MSTRECGYGRLTADTYISDTSTSTYWYLMRLFFFLSSVFALFSFLSAVFLRQASGMTVLVRTVPPLTNTRLRYCTCWCHRIPFSLYSYISLYLRSMLLYLNCMSGSGVSFNAVYYNRWPNTLIMWTTPKSCVLVNFFLIYMCFNYTTPVLCL